MIADRPVRIGLVGYGTIGRRLASAVTDMPNMQLMGVAVRRPTTALLGIVEAGTPIYATEPWARDIDLPASGSLDALLMSVDIVLDCTPRGTGKRLEPLYRTAGVKAIFQGGEADDLSEIDYCCGINFAAAQSAQTARIPSCNTTGLVRLSVALQKTCGIRRLRAMMTRSQADPDKALKGRNNDLAAAPGPSHHADDVKRLLPDLDIRTVAASASVNCGHLATLVVEMDHEVDAGALADGLEASSRVIVLSGGTGSLHDMRRLQAARHRDDCPSVVVWRDAIDVAGSEVMLAAGIHMESIVIPETLDLLQAMAGTAADAETAMKTSNDALALRQGAAVLERTLQ